MPGTAVGLVGLPDPPMNSVRDAAEKAFPNGYIFRSKAAPKQKSALALYDDRAIAEAVEVLADAVFGRTKRPVGFCRNPQRPCALKGGGRHTCGKSEADTCDLVRPDFLICIFQEGIGQNKLRETLYHSSYMIQIPRELYGQVQETEEFVLGALKDAAAWLAITKGLYTSSACPLLLPPKNFGEGRAVTKLLSKVEKIADPHREVTQFRRDWFDRRAKQYIGRSNLGFSPAQGGAKHGTATGVKELSLALSRHFRLGCAVDDTFHWDVRPANGDHLAKNYTIFCRATDDGRPDGTHANVLIDDCLR